MAAVCDPQSREAPYQIVHTTGDFVHGDYCRRGRHGGGKHYTPGEMRCKVETTGNHGGGDIKLSENFIGIMLGTEKSETPLEQGLLSAHMCLKARRSAQEHSFVKLDHYKQGGSI